MTTNSARQFLLAMIATVLSFGLQAAAPDPAPTPAATAPSSDTIELEAPDGAQVERDTSGVESITPQRRSYDHVIVRFGSDATLAAGQRAAGVISIVGSATSEGDVWEGVIAVLGNSSVRGTSHSVVAIFGDTFVDGTLRGDAVAIFGNVTLGPHAVVSGDVSAVGGVIRRDPAAIVHGSMEEVSLPVQFGHLEWLQPWLKHCLLYGRPLAFEPDISWAWTLAFGFLGLYVFIALLFPASVEKCVNTLESRPGHSLLAALLTMVLSPVLMVVLAITVVGIAIIPALWIALFCAGLFGKVVIIAALGRRLTRFISAGPLSHIAFPTLLGGLLLIGIYVVPVLGLIAYKVTGIIGLGVVVYTMMLAARTHREQAAAQTTRAAAGVPPSGFAADESASAAPATESVAPTFDTTAVNSLPRAGFMIRMAALLIDVILIAIVVVTLHAQGVWLLLLAVYGALMWKLRGTTVGGILCNLQVVRIDGRDIDWPTVIVRALGCFLSLFPGGLGFFWIVFDAHRQGWHDKLAGTIVVQVPPGRSLV